MKQRNAMSMLAVVAGMVLAFGTSAFKPVKQQMPTGTNLSEVWYEYTSQDNPFVDDNILDPDNYEATDDASATSPCDADNVFCSIRALPGPDGKADISGTSGLVDALNDYVLDQSNRDEDFIEEKP